jgi:TolB-like protein
MALSKKHIKNISSIFAILTALLILLSGANATAEEKTAKTVAVLPFAMHAPESMAYMQNGLRDMLASRLAANAGVTITENAKIDGLLKEPGRVLQQQEAEELALKLAVDYVVSGSLTSLGGSMSIDAKVFPADRASEPQSFYASAPKENAVIAAITMLAWDIAEKVFSAERPAHTMPARIAQPTPATPADDPMIAFRTEHPDKAYKTHGSVYGTGSPIMMTRSQVGGFTKTQNLDYHLRSMDVGDVDGDGQLDVVMGDTQNVYVYRMINNRLVELGSAEMPARSKIHAISLGDINENGRAEIYVSAADDFLPHSWAYEWDGSSLTIMLEDVPWYIKILRVPDEAPVLVGQRGGQSTLLRAGIFRLMKSGTKVMPEQRIVMPDYVNLFDFAMADVTGDGAREIIGINKANRMYVVRPHGSVLWVSDEYYSGTSRYIGEDYDLVGRTGTDQDSTHTSNVDTSEPGSGKRTYIPSRIIVMDVTNDGIADVILNKNPSTSIKYFENYKVYKTGEIHAMTWNGIGLTGVWQTKKIDGYIPDFQLLSLPDEKNKAKLFVGLVLSRGWSSSFSNTGESTILSYPIEFSEETENTNR